MKFEQPYHKLVVWQHANEFVKMVYSASKQFPQEERYGLTSQLQRAAVSVVLNIVEGQAKASTKDFIKFLIISRGSVSECACLLELAFQFQYITENSYQELEYKRRKVNYLLQQMIKSLNSKI